LSHINNGCLQQNLIDAVQSENDAQLKHNLMVDRNCTNSSDSSNAGLDANLSSNKTSGSSEKCMSVIKNNNNYEEASEEQLEDCLADDTEENNVQSIGLDLEQSPRENNAHLASNTEESTGNPDTNIIYSRNSSQIFKNKLIKRTNFNSSDNNCNQNSVRNTEQANVTVFKEARTTKSKFSPICKNLRIYLLPIDRKQITKVSPSNNLKDVSSNKFKNAKSESMLNMRVTNANLNTTSSQKSVNSVSDKTVEASIILGSSFSSSEIVKNIQVLTPNEADFEHTHAEEKRVPEFASSKDANIREGSGASMANINNEKVVSLETNNGEESSLEDVNKNNEHSLMNENKREGNWSSLEDNDHKSRKKRRKLTEAGEQDGKYRTAAASK
jgi:hypothetical protein